MSPVEELRQAAKMLRETAAKATRGPWVYHPTIRRHQGAEGGEYAWTVCRPYCENDDSPCKQDCGATVFTTGAEDCDEDFVKVDDVEWIALVHPGLAEPLAAWLEASAKQAEKVTDPRNQEIIADPHTLAVARAINGGAS